MRQHKFSRDSEGQAQRANKYSEMIRFTLESVLPKISIVSVFKRAQKNPRQPNSLHVNEQSKEYQYTYPQAS